MIKGGFSTPPVDNKEGYLMKIDGFKTVGYFVRHYFNWSMDDSDLEDLIEDFLNRENEEVIESFRNEIETLYFFKDIDLIREVFYKLGKRGIATNKAISIIELLYKKTRKS